MNILKSVSTWKSISRTTNCLIQKNGIRYCSGAANLVDVDFNNDTGYAIVKMQRPPVNGMNLELVSQLLTAFMDLEKRKCHGMILTSTSPKVFSAGLDITEMYKPQMERLKKFWTTLQDMWLQLFSSSYPTVALINGHSPAGGCLMACSCEYRVMLKGEYTIGLNETQLGIVAPTWFIDSFRNVVPQRITESALTRGKLFPVEEALQIGLIDEVATDVEDGMAKAVKFLDQFKKLSPAARAQTKLSLRYDSIKRLQDGREQDLKTMIKFVNLPEVQKGLEMYMQSLKNKSKREQKDN